MVAQQFCQFASRFFGFIVLPAQLPGEPAELLNDLMSDPVATLRNLNWSVFWALVRQIFHYEKLTLPDDPCLERMHKSRTKYLSRGWAHCPLPTADGITLDGFWKQPAKRDLAPRFVLFVGGNAQKYEDWLPYFQLYSDDSELGFLCFNFRGVVRSEGTVTCYQDLLTDVRAAFDFLVTHGVQPHHIVLHGFSLGASVATLFLAQPGAPRAAITSDRSFRSYPHAAFGLIRGFNEAVGDAPPRSSRSGDVDDDAHASVGAKLRGVGMRVASAMLPLVRALVAQIAVVLLKATGWELNALKAWRRIPGKKVIIYNHADNIIGYHAASLHGALMAETDEASVGGAGGAGGRGARVGVLSDTALVEVTIRYAQGWALHDFPLSLDLDAWYAMIAAERAAVGISKDGHELPEEHPTPSGGARAPMLDGLAAAVGGVPGGEMELVN